VNKEHLSLSEATKSCAEPTADRSIMCTYPMWNCYLSNGHWIFNKSRYDAIALHFIA